LFSFKIFLLLQDRQGRQSVLLTTKNIHYGKESGREKNCQERTSEDGERKERGKKRKEKF
jgi:hypothetical protein